MKYIIKKAFGCYLNLPIGEVREFSDADAIRYSHFIEPVNSESVNSLYGKRNKQYKKGRKKG